MNYKANTLTDSQLSAIYGGSFWGNVKSFWHGLLNGLNLG